jgi:hypothetical protein
MSEIRLRAVIRIGELSRELEKAEHGGAGGGSKFPPLGTSTEQALAEAGLSTSTANRYEQLVGRADWADRDHLQPFNDTGIRGVRKIALGGLE